jgi:pyrroloquinoline quinone biosynthesis protein D
MIRLNGSAGEILSCCDGQRSIDEIIAELTQRFPQAADLPADTREFLTVAHERQWIDFY